MDTTLDPLRNSELHRALAFARARETYPGLPGELLLELCDAAWSRSAGDTRDGGALERFERALDVVARSYRVGGGRLTVSEVAEDAIPLAALQPYIDAQKRRPAPVEPHPEPVAAPPRRTLADKLSRVPRIAPAPLGVSLAAGVFGVTAAAQAGVLDQTPLAPLSFTDRTEAPAPSGQAAPASDRRAGGDAAQGASGSSSAPADGGSASSWVGELASSQAAAGGDDDSAPAATSEPTAAGGPAVAQDLAGPTGGTPVAAAPTLVAAPAPAPSAPAEAAPVSVPARERPAIELPAVYVDLGPDDQEEGDEDAAPPTEEQQEHPGQPPVGVHFPSLHLPGGVVVEIPQAGQGEEEVGQDQPDKGEEAPPEEQLTPEELAGGEEDSSETQLPGEDDLGGQVPEEDLPEQLLPAEESPDGVAERVPAAVPDVAPPAPPVPAPAAPAAPPAPAPVATPPAPAPAPAQPAPAPAQPQPPAPQPPAPAA
ncbi:MAG TPA: hypothetical protein VEX39_08195 [Thermoleophilaceae bacterium]|nr:hypothetical protein [Thermoleophilaceae bacterium]